jgi:hypothetical protein
VTAAGGLFERNEDQAVVDHAHLGDVAAVGQRPDRRQLVEDGDQEVEERGAGQSL